MLRGIQGIRRGICQHTASLDTHRANLVVQQVLADGEAHTRRQGLERIEPAKTHNRVFIQLAQPLLHLRNLRNWVDAEDDTPEEAIGYESAYIRQLVGAIESRDPDHARATVARLMALPPEAIAAMGQTPVGEITMIPIPFSHRQV